MHAATEGRTDCVQLLLGAGADMNAKANVRGRFAASEFDFCFHNIGLKLLLFEIQRRGF